jgi:8-amino-7-oxononanoate synthase
MHIKELKKRMRQGALRTLKQREQLIDLTSNDYLGLSQEEKLRGAILNRWEDWCRFVPQKMGSTGSRLLTGNHRFFEETEEMIARFHGFGSATLFNCGYMANLALISCLCSEEDTLIVDREVHASLHDGMQLSRARSFYFQHNDLNHLEKRLQTANQRCFVVIESLYSMSGDKAPLKEISDLCQKYNAHLIVDEAHAIGVLGPEGKGLVAKENLQEKTLACMGAFGKALGAHGAVILGSPLLKTTLLNSARSLIYTTALPLPLLAGIACTYDLFPKMEKQRADLDSLCRHFLLPSHISPCVIPGNSSVKCASQFLAHHGFDVRPILSPTVSKGKERLRLSLHSFNTVDQVQKCLDLIQKWRGR